MFTTERDATSFYPRLVLDENEAAAELGETPEDLAASAAAGQALRIAAHDPDTCDDDGTCNGTGYYVMDQFHNEALQRTLKPVIDAFASIDPTNYLAAAWLFLPPGLLHFDWRTTDVLLDILSPVQMGRIAARDAQVVVQAVHDNQQRLNAHMTGG